MSKYLITGGAGFIGSNYVHYIIEERQKIEVVIIDKLTYAGNLENLATLKGNPRFKFEKVDICDKEALGKLFSENDFDAIVHFAAESHVDRSIRGPEEFIKTNIIGTFNLLEVARSNGWANSSKRFLQVSTDEVYGTLGDDGFFREDTPYQPNSPYSASKASSDHLVRSYIHTYGLPALTTNCSNNYGPYQFPEKLIPLMILNCLQKKPLPIYGKGENIRDWLFVRDHCSAIQVVIEKGKIGETYNIGSRNEWKNIDIVKEVCKIMNAENPEGALHEDLIEFVKDRPGHDMRYAIDSSKIENELGWRPAHGFAENLASTVRWYLQNKDWWQRIISGDYQNYYAEQYVQR